MAEETNTQTQQTEGGQQVQIAQANAQTENRAMVPHLYSPCIHAIIRCKIIHGVM